jgi:PAS domain S-box-containing protein
MSKPESSSNLSPRPRVPASPPHPPDRDDLLHENEELRTRLAEAEETLRAIREGEVDAVIVSGTKGEQIFSLVGTDSIYRLIVETMKEAAFTVTLDGDILFCNAQFGQFVKQPMERIVGHPLRDFVAETDRTAAATLLTNAPQQTVKQRLVFQSSDGSTVPAHVSASSLSQPDGLSICLVATDLTELENSTELIQQLRRQQEALQAANEELAATEEELRVQNEELAASRAELDRTRARYQDLFETAPDGYLVTDPEGTIQEANQEASRLLGRAAAELKGNPFSALLPQKTGKEYIQIMAAISVDSTPPRWEVEIQPVEGKRFWAAITAAATRDEVGQIIGLRWLIRDITARKQAEEALRKSNRELEYMNRHMTGRELRMVELKKEIDELCRQFGQPSRYGYGDDGIHRQGQQAGQ